MITIHHQDYTELKRKRKHKRDVEREAKLKEFGLATIPIPDNEPLSDVVRASRIRLLSYEYAKRQHGLTDEQIVENQRLRNKKKEAKRPKGEARSIDQYLRRKITNIKGKCRKHNIPCDISAEDFTMPEVCPVYGIKMVWGSDLADGTPSFDRFDPNGGYVKGNVRIISLKANRLKSNATIDDLKAVIAWMESIEQSTKP
jgi:hypothetical protein